MSNLDVFANLRWGDLSRYKQRNDAVNREERAAALDKRILALVAKTKNAAWAQTALDFYESETKLNKDVFGISKEAHRLNGIKEEALSLIKQENERIAADKRQLATSTDTTIMELSKAERGTYWCREVKNVEKQIEKMDQSVRVQLKRLIMLNQLVKEADLLLEADGVDEKIRKLKNAVKKDKAWITSVEKIKELITTQIRPKMKELGTYEELKKEVLKIQRAPVFGEYEECIKKVEMGQHTQETVRTKLLILDRDVSKHGFAMSEYIDNFNDRWAAAKKKVEAENKRIADEAEAKKKAEIERMRREKAAPYATCLAKVERDGVSSAELCRQFMNLDSGISKLGFQLSGYVDKFDSRWAAVKPGVQAELDRIAAAEKARKEEEERRVAELRRRQAADAAKRRRKEARREAAGAFFLGLLKALLFVLRYSVPVGLMAAGFWFASTLNFNARWYAPIIATACAVMFVHHSGMEEDEMYSAFTIIGQIVLYLSAIGFSFLFGYGIFNMIVCCGLIALVINAYPRLVYYSFDTFPRILQGIGMVAATAALILGMEKWLPMKLATSHWHALWMMPVLIAAICVAYYFCLRVDAYDEETAMAVQIIVSILTAVAMYIRAIVLIVNVVGFSFGMFWFVVLMLIVSGAVWFLQLGIIIAVEDVY